MPIRRVSRQEWLKAPEEQRVKVPSIWGTYSNPGMWADALKQQRQMEQQAFQETLPALDERGMPVDWDYSNPPLDVEGMPLGPWGQPLPRGDEFQPGPTGWTPYGEPDWGGGIQGFFREQYFKLQQAFGRQQYEDDTINALRMSQAHANWQASREGNWWERTRGNVMAGLEVLRYNFRKMETSETSPMLLRIATSFVGTAMDLAGTASEEPSRAYERLVSPGNIAVADYVDEIRQTDPDYAAWYDTVKQIPIVREIVNIGMGMPTWYSEEWQAKKEEYKQSEIWRMGYTAAYDEAARGEYMSRIRADENPRLLAMELESPGREAAGRIFADPLWIFDLGIFKKITRAVGFTRGPTRAVGIVAEAADSSDDLRKMMRAGSVTQAALAEKNIAQKFMAAAKRVADDTLNTARRRGAWYLTSGGKRFTSGETVGTHLMQMVVSPMIRRSADRMGDYIHSLMQIVSGVEDDVVDGLRRLGRLGIDPNHISDASMETGHLMRRIIGDGDPARLLAEIADDGADIGALSKKIGAKIDDALINVFPTVQEQIARHDEYIKLLNAGDEAGAAAHLAKYPLAADEIAETTRWIAAAHEAAWKYFYRPVSNIQGIVYMGLSPAYWIRNKLQNSFHIFVDQGMRAGVRSLFSPNKAIDEIQDVLGLLPQAATRGFGPGWLPGEVPKKNALRFFAQKSQQSEIAASVHMFRNSCLDSMRKMVQEGRVIPNTAEMLSSLPDETRDFIVQLSKKNWGDPEKVLDTLLEAKTAGGYDVARNLLFLTDDQIKTLQDLRIYDDITRVALEADDLDGAMGAMDDIARSWRLDSRLANRENPISALHHLPDHVQAHMEGATFVEKALGASGREMSSIIQRQALANHLAVEAMNQAMKYFEIDALSKLRPAIFNEVGVGKRFATIEDASQYLDDLMRSQKLPLMDIADVARRDAVINTRSAVSRAWDFTKRGRVDGADIPKLWRQYFNNDMPADVAALATDAQKQTFLNLIWDGYYGDSSRVWRNVRQTELDQMTLWGEILAKETYGDEWRLAFQAGTVRAREQARNARLYDQMVFVNGKPTAIFLPNENGIAQMADLLGDTFAVRVVDTIETPTGPGLMGLQGTYDEMGRLTHLVRDEKTGRPILEVSRAGLAQVPPERVKKTLVHEIGHLLEATIPDEMADDFYRLFPSPQALQGIQPDELEILRRMHNMGWRQAQEELELTEKILAQDILERFASQAELEEIAEIGRMEIALAPGQEARIARREQIWNSVVKRITNFTDDPEMYEAGFGEMIAKYYDAVWGGNNADRARVLAGMDTTQYSMFQRIISNPESKRFTNYLDELTNVKVTESGAFLYDLPALAADDIGASPAMFQHSAQEAMQAQIDQVKLGLQSSWGQMRSATFTSEQWRELNNFTYEMGNRLTDARRVAIDTATAARDFALHAYPKRYGFDLMLGMLYPYQFWYSRTYVNWMKRLVQHPGLISAYFDYRRFLEKQHAGMPEWWKYQINTNELLGLDMENPIYFNLEATLNPLYGITGTDFTDPRRRVDWMSSTIEDLNKFGPSVWTPYQLALATAYHIQGKDEAAARWAGRISTGTRTIRDVTAALGVNEGLGWDPDLFVHLFSGGIGPYERPRIGRHLSAMVAEGDWSEAEILDAARAQEGPIWQEAQRRMISERWAGNTFSWMAGAGFKPRSEHDIMVDRFYSEMYGLMASKDYLNPEEYRQKWDMLEQQYPFMDSLLLSRKGGEERDEAYAWNVLDRIPPGGQGDIAERVGMDRDVISQFYEQKGIGEFSEAERLEFMSGILKIAALLDVPDGATRAEWDIARQAYREMTQMQEEMFGEGVGELIDGYFASDDKDAYLRRFPQVEEALDWQARIKMQDVRMSGYYSGIEQIEKYYKGLMYEEAERELGSDLWDHFEVWSQLKEMDDKAASRYWKEHPQLGRYMDFKEANMPMITQMIMEIARLLPETAPPLFREEQEEEIDLSNDRDAWIHAQVMSYMGGGKDVPILRSNWSLEALRELLRPEEYNLVLDYLFFEQPLPEALSVRLEDLGVLLTQ